MNDAHERLQIINSFYKDAIEKRFSNTVLYAFQSGSVVYGGGTLGKSDLDIIIVFSDEIYSISSDVFIEEIKSFIPEYLLVHKKSCFNPDLTFPGEYISESMIFDAINGRGFSAEFGHLALPRASKEYYLKSDEHIFRSLLSQLAFNKFVTGNYDLYSLYKVRAWETIIKFILSNSNLKTCSLDELLSSLRCFGVHNDYYNFFKLELPWVRRALSRLLTEGLIISHQQEYFSGTQSLSNWNHELAKSIINCSVQKAKILTNLKMMSDLSTFTNDLWNSDVI